MTGVAHLQMALLRALSPDECRTTEQLIPELGWNRVDGQFAATASRLIIRGLISRAERGCYLLTPEGVAFLASGQVLHSGRDRPRTNPTARHVKAPNSRDRVWRAMRILGRASVRQIMEIAGPVAADTVRHYLADLVRAGYLRPLPIPDRDGGGQGGRYALIRDTGPDTPRIIQYGTALFDPNTGETISIGVRS